MDSKGGRNQEGNDEFFLQSSNVIVTEKLSWDLRQVT